MLGIAIATLATACGTPPAPSAVASDASAPSVEELLALDATLGGAELLRRRLGEDPTLIWTALDAEQEDERDRMLLAAIADEQPALRAFVAQRLDEATAQEVIAFLRSDAGRAAAAAQLMALTAYPVMQPEEFDAGCASIGDPELVGERARRQFLELQQRLAEGKASPSPPRFAWLLAAMKISPEQARQIRGFHATDIGRRWLALQRAAVADVRPVIVRVVDVARGRGWVRGVFDDFDLTLPRAEFDDEPGEAPVGCPDGGN